MADQSGFDLVAVTASFVVIVFMLYVSIRLIPALLLTLQQALPAIVIIWFIVVVLRGIVRQLLS